MIVVFGSINVDLVFQVDTLPQAGATVISEACSIHPGGKGANTAVAASRAGGKTVMVGRVGRDRFGENALGIMRETGVGLDFVAQSDRPTGCASICVDRSGDNAIVVASGANLDVEASQVPDSLLGSDTLVALQMEIPAAENWSLLKRAKSAGARVLLNLAPVQPVPTHALKRVDFLVVNETEAHAIAGNLDRTNDTPIDIGRFFALEHSLTCIITLGQYGALSCGPDGVWQVPALPVKAVDTTGAGDAFCGALAAALDLRFDLETALRYASTGASIACTIEGAQTGLPDRAAITARIDDLPDLHRLY